MSKALESYGERAKRFEAEVERLSARSRLMSNLRGLAFGTSAISAISAAAGASPAVTLPLALLLFAAFVVLIAVHGRVLSELDLAERWVDVNRDADARRNHDWAAIPDQGEGLAPADHPFAADLDLFGRGSLFQRLSVARTRFGRERLAMLLLDSAGVGEIGRRQGAVKALAVELDVRQRFEAFALGVVGQRRNEAGARRTRTAPNPEPLLSWAESESRLIFDLPSIWGARLLPPLNVAAAIAAFGFDYSALPLCAGLLLGLLVLIRSSRETGRVFHAVSSTEGAFLRYGDLLELIEGYQTQDPLLSELKARLETGTGAPSKAMARFRRIVGWFDLRHNALVYPLVNLALLWDVHSALALEHWRRDAGKHLRSWFEVIGWFEALSSLSSFAADEPGCVFPEVREGPAHFQAVELCHPLLSANKRVPNDVSLPGPGNALLITGSNMSGKSTLLRAMGISTVLAAAGAPVVARRFSLSPLVVATSIRVADSLEQGVSHFYAEITKLKRVLDAAKASGPVLFLLDEVLHGTNSRERQVGARWLLSELLQLAAVGAISTHDEELCRLPPNLMQNVKLVHLRESVEDGKMTFDYRVYPGPVTSGNALRLMRIVGLEVPLE